ncbi:MAG: Tol-Pal system beta propeller repeat protein TolB [Candidatus Aminicenantaceae bacterium]
MNTKKIISTISIIIFLFIGTTILLPQEEIVIPIKEGIPAIPIAVPKFIVHTSSSEANTIANELHDVILSDLKFSRVFQPLPNAYYKWIKALDPENIVFKDWKSIQSHLLLVGEITNQNQENILFEGKIYDVSSERFMFGKRYQSNKSLLRLMGHKMADELMNIYGEKPVFTSKIVFVSDRDGNDELYMMDYDGHNQTRITFNKVKDYMPAWSRDGKKVAYLSYRKNNAKLYILDIYEGEIIEIQSEGTNFAPSFSPDGKKLAFCSTKVEGNSEIYIASGNNFNKIKRLTFNNAVDTAPCWSSTGRQIAFTSDRSGTPQIYIMDAEGSNTRRISFGGNYHDAPAWSPDGNRIAYVSRVNRIVDIYVLNLKTNKIVKLTESKARNETPAWSPDGRHLIFSSTLSGTIQLYSIDYDGINLKQLTSQGNNKLPDWSR